MLWQKRHKAAGLAFRLCRINLILDVSWFLVAPASLWVIAAIYVPIMGQALTAFQSWATSVAILALIFLSNFFHSWAHVAVSKARGYSLGPIFLSPLGDPAHSQPAAPNAGKEALTALAGPLAQGLLAGLFYVLWNLQINLFINIMAFFLIFFNLGLMALNLIPAFPFDGGRLLRAAIWRILGLPKLAGRLAFKIGWVIAAGLVIWGIILIAQHARFSLETGGAAFVLSVLMIIALTLWMRWKWDRPETAANLNLPALAVRSFLVTVLLLPLAAVTFSLMPLNDGLEAPGFTASVEPMIQMPPQYRHAPTGSLILTTVIPQAPILAGEWAYARLDDSVKLEPENRIVPSSKTAQKVSLENYHMLINSETTAVIEGLRLAGYKVDIESDGVSVVSILPQSLAASILRPGDIITDIDGKPVTTPANLTQQLKLLTPGSILKLRINRSGKTMDVSVQSMEPLETGGPVRIGIAVLPHNNGFRLPFPVKIVSKKVTGGPSAGLMFTLGVYNLVTKGDLTGGRKIAGTGTIDLDGSVGPIGGVQQKVVAAERAGAQYFLSPPANYSEAVAMATDIKVVKVATAQDAINFLHSLPPLKGD